MTVTLDLVSVDGEPLSVGNMKTKPEVNVETEYLGMEIGQAVFVRGAVYHYTGRVEKLHGGAVYLTDAAWIADSGRWYEAQKTGELAEVEPEVNGVWIPIAAICDWRPWTADLPSAQR